MTQWYMLTLVGEDRPGIVAGVSQALYKGGCNLGAASMVRLGGNFTILLMVEADLAQAQLEELVAPAAEALGLRIHVDPIRGGLHEHDEPDARITVAGADRAGIVAQVTQTLADQGFNILDLESDVGGDEDRPLYLMHIEGQARDSIESLDQALEPVRAAGIDVEVRAIHTMVG